MEIGPIRNQKFSGHSQIVCSKRNFVMGWREHTGRGRGMRQAIILLPFPFPLFIVFSPSPITLSAYSQTSSTTPNISPFQNFCARIFWNTVGTCLEQCNLIFHKFKGHSTSPLDIDRLGLVLGLKLSAFFLPIVMFLTVFPGGIIFDNQPPHLLPPNLEPSISVRLA